jgi:hypothetical protein
LAIELPPRDPRLAYRRKTIAARRIGEGKQCACGEDRPEALISGSEPLICAACDRIKKGRRKTDDHHIAGEANDATMIRVSVNDHWADLSVAQRDWPPKTLQNPDKSPLLAAAASIRGFVNTSMYLMQHFLLPAAALLELLDTIVGQKLGRKWWKHTKLESFEPKP